MAIAVLGVVGALIAPAAADAAGKKATAVLKQRFVNGRVFLRGVARPREVLRDGTTQMLLVASTGITRINENGGIDATFGTKGKVIMPTVAATVLSGGKILVLGAESTLTRLLPNGKPDKTFGQGGRVPLAFVTAPAFTEQEATALTVLPSGRIVVAGMMTANGGTRAEFGETVILGLQSNGAPDPTFGEAGRLVPEEVETRTGRRVPDRQAGGQPPFHGGDTFVAQAEGDGHRGG